MANEIENAFIASIRAGGSGIITQVLASAGIVVASLTRVAPEEYTFETEEELADSEAVVTCAVDDQSGGGQFQVTIRKESGTLYRVNTYGAEPVIFMVNIYRARTGV